MTLDEGMGTTTSRGTHGKAVGKEEMPTMDIHGIRVFFPPLLLSCFEKNKGFGLWQILRAFLG
jgi:hypothetical protein